MINRFLSATLLAASFFGAATANAGYVEYAAAISTEETPWSYILPFNQFNPSLGTLTGVSFSLTGDLVSTLAGENKSKSASTLRNLLSGNMQFTLPNAQVSLGFSESFDKTVGAFDKQVDFAGASGYSGVVLSQQSLLDVYASDLSAFYGNGQFFVDVSVDSDSIIMASGNVASSVSTDASAQIRLRYDYAQIVQPQLLGRQPVPEPASLALVGMALLGLVLVRRRT